MYVFYVCVLYAFFIYVFYICMAHLLLVNCIIIILIPLQTFLKFLQMIISRHLLPLPIIITTLRLPHEGSVLLSSGGDGGTDGGICGVGCVALK